MNLRSNVADTVDNPEDEYRKGLRDAAAMEKARRFFEARQLYLAAVKARPDDLAAREGAARMAGIAGDHQGVIEHLRAALAAHPERDGLRERLVGALLHVGELSAAEGEARTILVRQPKNVAILNMLGVIQKRRGRVQDALATFRLGIDLEPSNHSPWYNLGNTFLGLGEFAQAVEAMKRASELKPSDSETMRLYGQALLGIDEHEQAMAVFDRAQKLNPKNCRVYTSRAAALQRAGASDAEVLAQIDAAIAVEPNNPEHMRAKAAYFQRRSRFAEAEAVHKSQLAKNPDDVETLLRLGHMLGYSLRRYEEANTYLRHALELNPNDPRCLSGLCKSLLDSRYGVESDHIEEAGKVGHKLIATGTDLMPHAANLSGVFLRLADYAGLDALGDRSKLMSYWVDRMNVGSLHNQLGRVVTKQDRRVLVYWHREWGRRVEEQAAKTPVKRPPPRSGLRSKIRIGLMSSDLRDHPVAYFALPIIEHYDRDRFEFICYSFYPAPPDRVQSFIQQRVLGFRSMLEATDQEIAQQIANDDLDILFELGGSTRYNRLEVMAYHAAPLQASWLGYPHSAGIGAIDYIMVDPYLKPDDPELLIEKPFVMPESWVVLGRLGFREEPIEPGIPEERNGFFTFGTMNNPYKYTPELFALWAGVMNRVPDSRFLFVRPEAGAPSFRANVAREFAKHGVSEDRLVFEAVRGKHMRHYNRIDIALDSAPHTGGTTTCETLWMGCPTVSLVGEAFFERLSYSNLSNAGLGDLCAFTREQFVDIAVNLAKNRERRLDLRQNLRGRLRTSPLGDAVRWVKNFEATVDRTLGRS
jgi:predicted O-linked N-acetylglucosamine transferase (SPINDLY family)